MRRIALVLSALALAAALAGSAAGASGWKRHAVPNVGVSLAVPASWVVIDSKLPPELVDRMLRENPKLAPFMQSLLSANSPTKFIALDPVVRNGFATNVNVVATPVPTYYRKALPLEIRNIAHGRVQTRTVTIQGARAVRLLYHLPLRFDGKKLTVQTLQYAFLRKARSVVVTYTTLPALAGRYARTFSSSAATVRFSAA